MEFAMLHHRWFRFFALRLKYFVIRRKHYFGSLRANLVDLREVICAL